MSRYQVRSWIRVDCILKISQETPPPLSYTDHMPCLVAWCYVLRAMCLHFMPMPGPMCLCSYRGRVGSHKESPYLLIA